MGSRGWDSNTKTFGNYEWMTYAEVAERRKNFGSGIAALHQKAGVTGTQYGVGLWCQNRPEWQITGKLALILTYRMLANTTRLGMLVTRIVYCLYLRHTWSRHY